LTIGLISAPYHIMSMVRAGQPLDGPRWAGVAVAAALGVGVGLAAVVVPLRVGIRTLRAMEF